MCVWWGCFFSSIFIWILEIKLWLLGVCGENLYLLSYVIDPKFNVVFLTNKQPSWNSLVILLHLLLAQFHRAFIGKFLHR